MLRCGKCGNKLFSSARHENGHETRRYVCSSSPDHDGCGTLTVVAAPVEVWIADAVIQRLGGPALADALAKRAAANERHAEISAALKAAQAKMAGLIDMWREDEISRAESKQAREPLEARVDQLGKQLAQITGSTALDGFIGRGSALRDTWPTLSLTRQVAIVAAVVDYATIGPGSPGARALDPSRITPTWSL